VGFGVQNEMEESQSMQRSPKGIEECLLLSRRGENRWGKECGMDDKSTGWN